MKYYLPRPVFGYLILSLVRAFVFTGISLIVYDIAGIDVPDERRMYIALVGFCVSIAFFGVRSFIKRNRRDYVRIEDDYIEWVNYESGKVTTQRIDVKEMRLLEITYFEGAKQPTFYSVYSTIEEQGGQLEIYDVPLQTIIEYGKHHGIPLLTSIIRYNDIESVSANTNRIRIKYYPKSRFTWWRSTKIFFSEVAEIRFVSVHPISKIEDHYVITTKDGRVFKFSRRDVNENMLIEVAAQNGIQIAG